MKRKDRFLVDSEELRVENEGLMVFKRDKLARQLVAVDFFEKRIVLMTIMSFLFKAFSVLIESFQFC